jgi:hypothetical protein
VSTQPAFELVVADAGLEHESALTLRSSFSGLFEKAEEWKKKAEAITITDASQVAEMKLARETRLALKEIRVEAEKKRKALKEDSLRRGKAIDGMANIIKFLIEPIEARLLEQEQFAERQEAARIAMLAQVRSSDLAHFTDPSSLGNLGTMSEEGFTQLREGFRLAHEAKIAAAKKAEEDRIAAEKAAAEERERIRQENERLRKEAAEREAAAKIERERIAKEKAEAEAKAAAERRAFEQALAKERAEAERIQRERQAKAAKERAELEAKARAEREAREKIEREQREREAAEKKRQAEEAAARERAASAPDRDKLKAFAIAIREIKPPDLGKKYAPIGKWAVEQLADIATQIENSIRQ